MIMVELFLKLFNRSVQGVFLIVVVILMRFLLRKSPKWIHCLLWALVAVRLVCPISIESAFSLAPSPETVSTTYEGRPIIQSPILVIDHPMNTYLGDHYFEGIVVPTREQRSNPIMIVSDIWAVGAVILIVYTFASYFRVRWRVRESVHFRDIIYLCDRISTPFILGIIKPRIYLPSHLREEQLGSVIAHEQAHLKRGDHFWKPFGFCLLAVYWFNPFCLLAYVLLCRDIEMACDERVIKNMDLGQRKNYAKVLLSLSVPGKYISACPLAFGEIGVKQRIRSVLNHKKPAFWVTVVAIVTIVAASVLFLTNPKSSDSREDPLSETNHQFIRSWAQAFCDRDWRTILALSSEHAQDSLVKTGLLDVEEDYASFGWSSPWPMWSEEVDGYRIVYQDDRNMQAEILYYAWTSDPHVWVWKERISFEEKEGTFMVTEEEFHSFDFIASGMEFEDAYPILNGTLMDYTQNGWGDILVQQAIGNDKVLLTKLQDPIESARYLLNLSDTPNKVEIDYTVEDVDPKDGTVDLMITFQEDGANQAITMISLDETNGIWVPQDYGSASNLESK